MLSSVLGFGDSMFKDVSSGAADDGPEGCTKSCVLVAIGGWGCRCHLKPHDGREDEKVGHHTHLLQYHLARVIQISTLALYGDLRSSLEGNIFCIELLCIIT